MNKLNKPAGVAPAKPLTEEEKKVRIMQFLQQKREQFSINILCNIIQGDGGNFTTRTKSANNLVEAAVSMADALLEKLYPLPEEKKADAPEEKPKVISKFRFGNQPIKGEIKPAE